MGKVLVIGCGGVAGVAIQKCAQNDTVFDEIVIASRKQVRCTGGKIKRKDKSGCLHGTGGCGQCGGAGGSD